MDGQIDNMKERQREEGEAEQERDERSEWSGGWRRAVISAGLRPHLVTKLKAFHFSSLLAASLAPHTLTLWLYFTAVEHTPSYITAQFRAALDKTRITTSVSILATFSSYIHIKSCYCSLFPSSWVNTWSARAAAVFWSYLSGILLIQVLTVLLSFLLFASLWMQWTGISWTHWGASLYKVVTVHTASASLQQSFLCLSWRHH